MHEEEVWQPAMKSESMLMGILQQRKIFTGLTPLSRVESKTKGSMILRYSGRFYKVLKIRSRVDNNYIFEAKDLDTKRDKVLEFNMSGLLEAADQAFKAMKSPKDILFLDLDNNGKWKVVNEDQLKKL
jgi:hypothetical protein